MKRAFPACGVACSFVELELQYARKEITGIGCVAWDVIFGTGIKGIGRTFDRRHDTLILLAQSRPGGVVIRRYD